MVLSRAHTNRKKANGKYNQSLKNPTWGVYELFRKIGRKRNIYMCIYEYTYVYTNLHIHMYIQIYIYMYIHVYICINFICIHTYVYMYKHTYIYTTSRSNSCRCILYNFRNEIFLQIG